jgi:hypothetical protein
LKGVNLIPQPLYAARRRKRRLRRWALGCAAYAAALMMTCALMRGVWCANYRSLDSEIASTNHRIEDANRRIAGLRTQLFELQEQSRTAEAIADQPDWSILQNAVAVQMEDDLVLREVRLGATTTTAVRGVADTLWAPKRYQLSIHGVARTPAGVSKFVSKLEQMQFFDDVKLLRTSREEFLNGPAVSFEVETSFGPQQRRTK